MVIDKNVAELHNAQLSNLLNPKWIYSDNQNITLQNINVLYEPVIVGHEIIGTLITCREITRIQQLENKIRRDLHAKGLVARFSLTDIIHTGEKMKDVITLAAEYAATDSTILLIGESGTGKELFAQGIHNASKRKDGPFVAVNCAALPENLLESELFGYA
jgi:transcriptional regulator with PAS, ATPase and Fis domain